MRQLTILLDADRFALNGRQALAADTERVWMPFRRAGFGHYGGFREFKHGSEHGYSTSGRCVQLLTDAQLAASLNMPVPLVPLPEDSEVTNAVVIEGKWLQVLRTSPSLMTALGQSLLVWIEPSDRCVDPTIWLPGLAGRSASVPNGALEDVLSAAANEAARLFDQAMRERAAHVVLADDLSGDMETILTPFGTRIGGLAGASVERHELVLDWDGDPPQGMLRALSPDAEFEGLVLPQVAEWRRPTVAVFDVFDAADDLAAWGLVLASRFLSNCEASGCPACAVWGSGDPLIGLADQGEEFEEAYDHLVAHSDAAGDAPVRTMMVSKNTMRTDELASREAADWLASQIGSAPATASATDVPSTPKLEQPALAQVVQPSRTVSVRITPDETRVYSDGAPIEVSAVATSTGDPTKKQLLLAALLFDSETVGLRTQPLSRWDMMWTLMGGSLEDVSTKKLTPLPGVTGLMLEAKAGTPTRELYGFWLFPEGSATHAWEVCTVETYGDTYQLAKDPDWIDWSSPTQLTEKPAITKDGLPTWDNFRGMKTKVSKELKVLGIQVGKGRVDSVVVTVDPGFELVLNGEPQLPPKCGVPSKESVAFLIGWLHNRGFDVSPR